MVAYEGSDFEKELAANMERLAGSDGKEGPDRAAEAMFEALASDHPKARYLVVSNQRDADVTISKALRRVFELNEDQPLGFSRDALREMFDKAAKDPNAKGR